MTALLVMAAVFYGAFFAVIHNNVNGLGERYRKSIQGIPVLRLALPAVPDPEDPKYLTQAQLIKKYNELRKTKDDLTSQLEQSQKEIQQLQKSVNEGSKTNTANDKLKKELDAQKKQNANLQKQLDEETKKAADIIARSDKQGFQQYFEKVDSETAKQIYTEIMKDQKADEDAKKFAQLYESMDTSAAAKILEQLGTAKIGLVVDIMKNLKNETSAAIMAEMSPTFASKVTEKLSSLYMKPSPSGTTAAAKAN